MKIDELIYDLEQQKFFVSEVVLIDYVIFQLNKIKEELSQ